MLLDDLTTARKLFESVMSHLEEASEDLDVISSFVSSLLAEGDAQGIEVVMGGESDLLEDILSDFEDELDQVKKEEFKDLLKQIKIMRNLFISLERSLKNSDI